MKSRWFTPLLIALTLASIAVHFWSTNEPLRFTLASISLLLWAALLGKATESVAHYAGERLGGFLNATFGNAAELIIAIFLVQKGLFDMVKASITGSIIGNLLLVLGLSIFAGGLKFKTQSFNTLLAGHNASLMLLAVIALFSPAAFDTQLDPSEMETFSLIIAGLLIASYLLWLIFSMITHKKELGEEPAVEVPTSDISQTSVAHEEKPEWTKNRSILLLFIAAVFVAIQSEWIVGSVEAVAHTLGWSELFVGAFLIAIIGNAAEHSAAIFLAMRNRIGAAVEIAVGSSLQIALFVAPALVFISLLFGKTMNLTFTAIEIAAIAIAAFIATSISRDGSTNWFEGVLLLIVYAILGTGFYLV
ncbi:calcium/proton exchanger [Marininema halotolerans]|uniref:Ca(2+)/H(+) antiporter n=1 Tax=Marininema halotolerans TaxID=1155944 RepID=A0A1I6SEX1_9BACL|nr:calcium/proton exchanger [Marininema halotolerans]SFS75477.1 Ca2+:H+ antiporter [Marininema halotolerans]